MRCGLRFAMREVLLATLGRGISYPTRLARSMPKSLRSERPYPTLLVSLGGAYLTLLATPEDILPKPTLRFFTYKQTDRQTDIWLFLYTLVPFLTLYKYRDIFIQ